MNGQLRQSLRVPLRAANAIRDEMRQHETDRLAPPPGDLAVVTMRVDQLQDLSRRLEKALSRRWFRTARILRRRSDDLVGELRLAVEQLVARSRFPSRKAPRLRGLADEIDALRREFEGFDWQVREGRVAVRTTAIVLEDVPLGRFEIALPIEELRRTDRPPQVEIDAVDPNPAAGNDGVTHPHVSDQRPCLGDAQAAFTTALEDGRICDAFLVVRSVLETYNPDSPFVKLEDWEGRPCHDCGDTTREEDEYACECCEDRFCSDCICGCTDCSSSFCRSCVSCCSDCCESTCEDCLAACQDCGDSTCSNCRETCDTCGEYFCHGCLEDNLCPNCREEENDDDETTESIGGDLPGPREPELARPGPSRREPDGSGPSLHADGLGEALLSLPSR